ncbi:outer membrane protein OmpK [Pontiellaceae bacterium B12227]|nr:outer membrane protein OmpK [Pontiellaceae bacterium B12227]
MKRTLLALTALTSVVAYGGDFIQWTDTSLTGLYGSGFEVDPETQQTLTIEHANGWKWGDFFWFHDAIYYDGDTSFANGKMSYYGEISPRVSFGKVLNKDLSVSFVKDWLVAICYEYGELNGDDFGLQNYLVGAGVDLSVPGLDFFQLNFYRRFNSGASEVESYQLTPVWRYTAELGESAFICDGFIDWVFGDGTDNLHICPQFKFDVGALVGMKSRSLLAGVEYDYWKNKYDIQNAKTQHAISGILQYHF